ncbi:MAG TPA: PhnD/SsuA/transferrin family substrate-binding protein [Accumulibacter sp.]|uniref:PhnD/SsuA/transferrin family substrate-binding protein n=2 Tax=Accumulibacter sp. TaxID=2053492 RepID=UPI00262160B7|nr:PhnD/SsuA/transferrin family substrate-binding protein [Accumulibacter sp.]MDS4056843.1 PhnD/SsuA/transferrin family substrate-binding protein [Accumulibacter sp.]HMV05418.1 PhnD/SsuA/transferrin family substrate-binding protein [Accumulibacter sp.]HMW62572.1 PhnD/SsuA/transferrin family substrate-binding protein [Accumulibacter sp.]HMW79764.1 PhnD/SsuA/transferrin family substrate-binding protein [Accumulibacter sp.]HMX68486.1 PhnD/SsuA/transferrin family substrate-binding protein [Accumul
MKLNFMVAPDFSPDRFAGWHMVNTLLQSRSGLQLHLLTPSSAQEQADLLRHDKADLIYANPFDAAHLIRDLGFRAFARPVGKPDEMVIATAAASPLRCLEDLRPGSRIAVTDNRDVKLIGLRLLEAADLTDKDLQWVLVETFQAGARLTIKGEVDAGFFLAEIYHSLSRITRSQLKVLIESAIFDITHVLLAHQRIVGEIPAIMTALSGIGQRSADHEVLEALGIPGGFEKMNDEEAEFMVDLMDTLLD